MRILPWDADQASLVLEDDGSDEVSRTSPARRYGTTGWELAHPEPFTVALAQETADVAEEGWVDEAWDPEEVSIHRLIDAERFVADDDADDDDMMADRSHADWWEPGR